MHHALAMEVLAAVTVKQVLRYLNMNRFGMNEPAGDANPIFTQGNLFAMAEKGSLYFMPNCNVSRATRTKGNPTFIVSVNALIKNVKKEEACRKRGVKLNILRLVRKCCT